MNKKLIKKMAVESLVCMLLVVTLSFAFKRYQSAVIEASGNETDNVLQNIDELATIKENTNVETLIDDKAEDRAPLFMGKLSLVDEEITEKLNKYILIKKTGNEPITLFLEDLYITKCIRITLSGLDNNRFNSGMVGRVNDDELYVGDPDYEAVTSLQMNADTEEMEEVITKDYGNDFAHEIIIETYYDVEENSYSTEIFIQLDDVYAHLVEEDDNYFYIELKKPKEVYDKVLVVDAGHGGKDGGALSAAKDVYEKNINLDILLKLKELLDKEDIKVYYTRMSDETIFLRPRVDLANSVESDFFISIHCNSSTSRGPNGTQIYYYDKVSNGVKVKDLAIISSEEMDKAISLKKQGIVKKKDDDIFILKKAEVPAIIIEVGYMSNSNDLYYMNNNDNRKNIADGIYNSIMRAYEELMQAD